jgi:hypothetical protein
MSLTSKLRTAISASFILTIAGVIGVAAQTPTVADTSSTSAATNAATTSEPKKAEGTKPSTASTETAVPDKTAEASRKASNASTSESVPADPPVIPSPQAPASDEWQFQFSPYFWLASLHGTTGTANRTAQVDESFSDIFHTLNFAFMGVFEARKGKLVSLTDMEYVNVSDDRATPGPLFSGVTAKVKMFIFDPEVGYRVFDDPDKGQFVDVLGGVRVWHISTDLTFSPGILAGQEVQASRTWVDAVVGLRGKAALSKKFFVTGKFDLGGGGSKFAWQLFGGAGYNITPKIALIGGYRVLDVNYDKNNFIYDMNQRGPILGVGFKF